LGAQLKQAREQRGVGLDEIAQTTKIGTRFLRALEADHYDQLPGGIFNKGFIRAYARAVGLDEEKAVAEYVAATEPGPVKSESSAQVQSRPVELRAEAESPGADLPWGVFAIVLVLVALGLAGWGFYSRESHETGKPPARAVAAGATSPATGSVQPLSSPGAGNAVSSGPIVSQQNAAASIGSEGQPAAKRTPDNTTPASRETAAVPAGYFSVRVNVREDSWLSISADGRTILQGRFVAPAQKSVKARNRVVVQTGNAGGLDFEFNGHSLPRQGKPDEVKTLIFGVHGLEAMQFSGAPASPQP
jgi:cytoskeleton protein RodZ